MKQLILFTIFTFLSIQLQGCASSGAGTNQPVGSYYNTNPGVSSNMNYIYRSPPPNIYRSPPPNVARALSGR